MKSDTIYKILTKRILIVLLSALAGCIILVTGSVIQKTFINVPLFDIKSYLIPILYGIITGAIIGLLLMRALISKQIILKEYENIHKILQSMNTAIVATDKNKKIICFNDAAANITGILSKEALNKQSNDIIKIHQSKNEDYINISNQIDIGMNKSSQNCYLQNKDEELINVDYSAIFK